MSADLRELYQEMILDHGKRPRNFRVVDGLSHEADGYNPLCGDELQLTLRVEDGVIQDIAFQGSGCAISTASASLMTSALKGRRVEEVGELFELFREMVTADRDAPPPAELGKLAVLGGVREFPVRVKCATLAWHTLRAALGGNETSATTE